MMACYCRVSTRRQKTDSQKADILHWLTGNAVTPAAVQWFEDVDSGTTLKRPAFARMQQGIFTCNGLQSKMGRACNQRGFRPTLSASIAHVRPTLAASEPAIIRAGLQSITPGPH